MLIEAADTVLLSRSEHAALLADRAALVVLQAAFEKLQLQFQTLLRQRFGSTSESADQLMLFGSSDVEVIEQTVVVADAPITPKRKPVAERQRLVLPAGLPEQRIEIDVPEADKINADGEPLKRIGEEVTVKLGYTPASFFKKLIVRPKYVDPRNPDAGVKCAPLPAQLIDGSLLDASFGAYLLQSKYGDHLPLFRIEEICQRSRVPIARSTLSDWVLALSDWLKPLVLRMRAILLTQHVIHVDETVLPLQSVGRTISARAWAYVGRDPRIVLYDFTVDKAGHHVRDFLQGWRGGYLQADAASNYDALFRQNQGILEVACWAHARRKFFDIAVVADKAGQRVLAHEAIEQIGELFAIERAASEADDSPEQRCARRLRESKPLLDDFKVWCEKHLRDFLPKSPTAGAITYALKNWDALTRYLDDGAIAIDNNAAERALREIATACS